MPARTRHEFVITTKSKYYPLLQELSYIRPLRMLSPAMFVGGLDNDPLTQNSCHVGWGSATDNGVTVNCSGTLGVAGTGRWIYNPDESNTGEDVIFDRNSEHWSLPQQSDDHDGHDHGDGSMETVTYTCNTGAGTITVGEHCDDSCGTCEFSETIQDGECYIIDNTVHTATCAGATATVHIYNDHSSCSDDLSGLPTEDHQHASGACEEVDHDHGDDHDGHDHGGDHAWEWAGVFEMPTSGASIWTFEKVDGKYADSTMQFCWLSADTNNLAGIEGQEAAATECYEQTATVVNAGATLEADTLYTLTFDSESASSSWSVLPVTAKPNAVFFLEHFPYEFEATQHFLKSSSGDDIEPAAEEPEKGGHVSVHRYSRFFKL